MRTDSILIKIPKPITFFNLNLKYFSRNRPAQQSSEEDEPDLQKTKRSSQPATKKSLKSVELLSEPENPPEAPRGPEQATEEVERESSQEETEVIEVAVVNVNPTESPTAHIMSDHHTITPPSGFLVSILVYITMMEILASAFDFQREGISS